jgi:hypothetical protein
MKFLIQKCYAILLSLSSCTLTYEQHIVMLLGDVVHSCGWFTHVVTVLWQVNRLASYSAQPFIPSNTGSQNSYSLVSYVCLCINLVLASHYCLHNLQRTCDYGSDVSPGMLMAVISLMANQCPQIDTERVNILCIVCFRLSWKLSMILVKVTNRFILDMMCCLAWNLSMTLSWNHLTLLCCFSKLINRINFLAILCRLEAFGFVWSS